MLRVKLARWGPPPNRSGKRIPQALSHPPESPNSAMKSPSLSEGSHVEGWRLPPMGSHHAASIAAMVPISIKVEKEGSNTSMA